MAQQVELPKDTEGGAGFRRHKKENPVGSPYAFSMRQGDITSRRNVPCFQFLFFFINMCREQRLLLTSKQMQILEQCTQEASRFCLILRHVAKSTRQSCHSSRALSPYCTLLGLADTEIGCQLQMGSLSLA